MVRALQDESKTNDNKTMPPNKPSKESCSKTRRAKRSEREVRDKCKIKENEMETRNMASMRRSLKWNSSRTSESQGYELPVSNMRKLAENLRMGDKVLPNMRKRMEQRHSRRSTDIDKTSKSMAKTPMKVKTRGGALTKSSIQGSHEHPRSHRLPRGQPLIASPELPSGH